MATGRSPDIVRERVPQGALETSLGEGFGRIWTKIDSIPLELKALLVVAGLVGIAAITIASGGAALGLFAIPLSAKVLTVISIVGAAELLITPLVLAGLHAIWKGNAPQREYADSGGAYFGEDDSLDYRTMRHEMGGELLRRSEGGALDIKIDGVPLPIADGPVGNHFPEASAFLSHALYAKYEHDRDLFEILSHMNVNALTAPSALLMKKFGDGHQLRPTRGPSVTRWNVRLDEAGPRVILSQDYQLIKVDGMSITHIANGKADISFDIRKRMAHPTCEVTEVLDEPVVLS